MASTMCRMRMMLGWGGGGGSVRALIEAELGAPLDELFVRFDERPAAAASIAQASCPI